jgi:hypothetical protein
MVSVTSHPLYSSPSSLTTVSNNLVKASEPSSHIAYVQLLADASLSSGFSLVILCLISDGLAVSFALSVNSLTKWIC